LPYFALAQVTPDAGALQQNMQRQMQTPSTAVLPQPSAPEYAPLELSKSETLFIVKRFALTGVKLVAVEDLEVALKPWLDREISFADLQKAMNVIETMYRDKGYLAQVILSPQALRDGLVTVEVLEAKLGAVIVERDKEGARFDQQFASDFVTGSNKRGEALNIDDISRSLTLLNEVPGVKASSVLEAGEQVGDTNLRINLADTNLLTGRAEANNYGSRTTGIWQGVVGGAVNNPSGYGDQLSLSGIYAQGSRYTQGSYNFPLGASGLRLNLSGSDLRYTNIGEYAANGGRGSAALLSAELSYPLMRKQTTNINLTARYDYKAYLNNNLATDAVVSQYSINSVTVGMTGNHFDGLLGGAITTASVGLVLGQLSVSDKTPSSYGSFLDAYGLYTSYLPTNYAKVVFNFNRNQTLVTDKLSLKLNVSGQVSNVNLNSAEQFYLGGPYAIRAYPVAQGGGSQGAILNVELQKNLPHQFTASTFFDVGTVQQYREPYLNWQGSTNASNIYSLAGAGFGIKYVSKGLAVSATLAWRVGKNPLYSQSGVPVNTDNTNTNPMGWLSLSYQLDP